MTGNTTNPMYIIKIVEKGKASEQMHDRDRHIMFPGELHLKGYLIKTRSKSVNKKQFSLLDDSVLIIPDYIFGCFVDISVDLNMNADIYVELSERSQL